jgi:type III restriction enzyme
MPPVADRQVFRNEDLVLTVSPSVDRSVWDESRYEEFLDALCGDREFQKQAIREALRYLLGREYRDLEHLARDNYDRSPVLARRTTTLS